MQTWEQVYYFDYTSISNNGVFDLPLPITTVSIITQITFSLIWYMSGAGTCYAASPIIITQAPSSAARALYKAQLGYGGEWTWNRPPWNADWNTPYYAIKSTSWANTGSNIYGEVNEVLDVDIPYSETEQTYSLYFGARIAGSCTVQLAGNVKITGSTFNPTDERLHKEPA